MSRNVKLYLDDILTCIERTGDYVGDLSFEELSENQMVIDAVVRNLEVIGEAAKHIPDDLRSKYSYDWRSVAGLRDILIHEYFGVSMKILWDIVQNELPGLEVRIKEIIEQEDL